MSRSIAVKAVAIALCALSLLVVAGSGLAMVLLERFGLYTRTPEECLEKQLESNALEVAEYAVTRYNIRNLGSVPQELLDSQDFYIFCSNGYDYRQYQVEKGLAGYTLASLDGKVLDSVAMEGSDSEISEFTFTVSSSCPVVTKISDTRVTEPDIFEETDAALTDPPEASEPTNYGENYQYTEEWELATDSGSAAYRIAFYEGPDYAVTVRISNRLWSYGDSQMWALANLLYGHRYGLIGILLAGLTLFVATLIYLGWAAGKKPGSGEIQPAGLNRLPLDLYLCGGGICVTLLLMLAFRLVEYLFYSAEYINVLSITLAALLTLAAAVICACFYCALAAQVKVKGGYWWRHSVTGWCLLKLWHGVRWCWRGIRRLFTMVPLVWQWILTGAGMGLVLLVGTIWSFDDHSGFPAFCAILIFGAAVCYSAYAFGTLYAGARRMARGDLTQKIPVKYLWGSFRDFANRLNALADVAVDAARNQLKSERMKTELITNVSHDIKTPLTSIINYVDLLRKPHTEQEGAQYLEVLSRQSQRMKKLLEDLMEMSKASTGNIHAEIQELDAAETVNQALGKFADKLASVSLTPVFPQPEKPIRMMADGRLAWRVLSNVLSNAVKYALPGTRLYVDIAQAEHDVIISLKNISREQLNISAEELMERFVRGDTSRNTEGSGLGLNIAQSLMELQHGKLRLVVDGDLFKVTLIFPGA